MSDIRKELYGRYVSTFKTEQLVRNEPGLQSYWSWCDHKYLPILSGLRKDDAILEVGCGHGNMLEYLAARGFVNVEGVDISEEQIDIAIRRGLKAWAADALEYMRSNVGRYKAIIAIDFIEHFPKDELLNLLRSIHGSLTEGGILIVQTPNGQGLFPHQIIYGDLTHYTILTPDSLKQILRFVEFEAIEFRETGPVPSSIKGKVRVALWKIIKLLANAVRQIEAGKPQEIWTENVICYCRKAHG